MHDWSGREARQAASERHQRELRRHTGYPRSSGSALSVLCLCGQDFSDAPESTACQLWEQHLVTLIEGIEQHQ